MDWDKDTWRIILDELSERNELTLYELTTQLVMKPNLVISRQAITKHLNTLGDAGLVISKRKGKHRVLTFNKEPLRSLLEEWLN
ncbi:MULTISPECIES: ArsR/SmtB family transcription factor [Lysinibacillus]|uniref:ArsR/SmtB family transcription factor n=1 Tax=Lysinibacillus TaxID=400634 RepID=UPI00257C1964|nr:MULTISPECIES: helix-turn-helix domain-containing protein [Lysinibacillus]